MKKPSISHVDLKAWMKEYYPDQKPGFLFDDIERDIHQAISIESFHALQADRDALKAEIDRAKGLKFIGAVTGRTQAVAIGSYEFIPHISHPS